jgi:two-component system, NarL family, response regulator NreC
MSDPITVVLADDHAVVRAGLRYLLDAEDEIDVVGEAGDFPRAISVTDAMRPDVLVLDLGMPGGTGLETIATLVASVPETAIVVLTMQDDPAFARGALSRGARGYVLKEGADEELLDAIRAAARGETYLNPRLGARLATERPAPPHDGDELTGREADVLRRIALGHTNAEIADQLFLSVRTIETHRAHIQSKLNRTSRAALVGYALEHKLLQT